MELVDYVVLVIYFLVMATIGWICSRRIKHQEDFLLGGRSFGKLLQAFAAFGAGTGAYDPVALGRTTFTSGLSGIWSVLLWLFVTPFYWITGVWYRRMRHLTLGDWFVERYESRSIGAAYAVFAVVFNMVYLSVSFSAVGKVCAPLLGFEAFELPGSDGTMVDVEYVLVPIIAVVVVLYGVLGGLRAAYWTDLIQGIFIILLSVLLIPSGLKALVEKFGDGTASGVLDGFRVMHEQVPESYFRLLDTPRGGEFPVHYILAITFLNLVGVVVQPHFIATGGGSAKTETSARVGLVVGNFLKRLCTVGWALTGLIVLALLADNVQLAEDPDRSWGVAAIAILGPLKIGLVGLMLACLLAALMSSADCYMLVTSGLVVRNLYVPFLAPNATDRECLLAARLVSLLVILGGVVVSLAHLDVFDQLQIAWELPVIFAAPFWIGMYWRRATRWAAWVSVLLTASLFFVLPFVVPALWPSLRESERYTATNVQTVTTTARTAAPADVARRRGQIAAWEKASLEAGRLPDAASREAAIAALGPRPRAIAVGETIEDTFTSGGRSIFWYSGVQRQDGGPPAWREIGRETKDGKTIVHSVATGELRGEGPLLIDLVLYDAVGVDLGGLSNSTLKTMRLPPLVLFPFVVMILISLVTPRGSQEALDRYYVKMKTPVSPDPEEDRREMERSYAEPRRFEHKRLLPGTDWEVQRPTKTDVAGFILSVIGTFVIIWLAVALATIGS